MTKCGDNEREQSEQCEKDSKHVNKQEFDIHGEVHETFEIKQNEINETFEKIPSKIVSLHIETFFISTDSNAAFWWCIRYISYV